MLFCCLSFRYSIVNHCQWTLGNHREVWSCTLEPTAHALLACCRITVSYWGKSHQDSHSVTREKATWLLPAAISKVDYQECARVDISGGKTTRLTESARWMVLLLGNVPLVIVVSQLENKPANKWRSSFLSVLHKTGSKSTILSLIEPDSEFSPQSDRRKLPSCVDRTEKEWCNSHGWSWSIVHVLRYWPFSNRWASEDTWGWYKGSMLFNRCRSNHSIWSCCTDPNQPAQSFIRSVTCTYSHIKVTACGCDRETCTLDMFTGAHKQ